MINYLMMPYLGLYYRRFQKASRNNNIQYKLLENIIRKNRDTLFGREHNFHNISSYNDLVKRIPLSSYDYYSDYISRICRGEQQVLTTDKVKLMEPTSGTISGTKLIPYTSSLQSDFKRGIYPWLYDLYRNTPPLLRGKAYWSLSPATENNYDCSVPVGFLHDSEYLGFIGRFIERGMAVPSSVSSISDNDLWKLMTCAYLVSSEDLSFISVWNPQFLTLILEHIKSNGIEIIKFIEDSDDIMLSEKRLSLLKNELQSNTPDFRSLWPHLHIISCWTEGYASLSVNPLNDMLPFADIQPKGLIATEAFVSFPLTGYGNVLSVLSHFFEFMDNDGNVFTADKISQGNIYSVIITSSGGLYRYNLGDRVRVSGFYNQLPILEFIGRNNNVLDFFGEKLEEEFIFSTVHDIILKHFSTGFIAFLPCFEGAFHYRLYIGSNDNIPTRKLACAVDKALSGNYHYNHARQLGQIDQIKISHSSSVSYTRLYIDYMQSKGIKKGDIKPIIITDDRTLYKAFEV